MDRRRFLGSAAAGTLGLCLPAASWATDPAPVAAALARPALLALLGAPRVREIGVSYREACPGERDARTLSEAVLQKGRRDLLPASVLEAHLAGQVRDDFATGRTVVLKGWVLSLTEARQCALFSLLPA